MQEQPSTQQEEKGHGWLGIQMQNTIMESGPQAQGRTKVGILIKTVFPGSAAEEVELKPGDLITELDGKPTSDSAYILQQLANTAPGEEIILTVIHGHITRLVRVTLKEEPEDVRQYNQALVFNHALALGNAAVEKGEFRQALPHYQKALRHAERLLEETKNNPNTEAIKALFMPQLGWLCEQVGWIHNSLKEYSQGLKSYSEAIQYYEMAGNLQKAARILDRMGLIYSTVGDHKRALQSYNRALAVSDKDMETKGENERLIPLKDRISIWHGKALSHRLLSEISQEIETRRHLVTEFQELQTLLNSARDSGTQVKIKLLDAEYGAYGNALAAIGEDESAIQQYHVALQLLEGVENDPNTEAFKAASFTQLGRWYYKLGKYEDALEYNHRALVKYRSLNNLLEEATALENIGIIFGTLGNYNAARNFYESALSAFERAGSVSNQISTLTELASAAWYSEAPYGERYKIYLKSVTKVDRLLYGESAPAIKDYSSEEIADFFELGTLPEDVKERASYRLNVFDVHPPEVKLAAANYYQMMGKLNLFEAEENGDLPWKNGAMELLFSLKISDKLQDSWEKRTQQGYTKLYLGAVLNKMGKYNLALESFEQAKDYLGPWGHTERALSYWWLGKVPEALDSYRTGLAQLESQWSAVHLPENKIDSLDRVAPSFQPMVVLLMRLYEQSGELKYLKEAFQTSERLRAREFHDTLTRSQSSRFPGQSGLLAKEERAFQRKLVALHRQLRTPNLSEGDEVRLADELTHLREERTRLETRITNNLPPHQQAFHVQTAIMETVQSALDESSVFLEYSVVTDGMILFVITDTLAQGYFLPDQTIVPIEEFRRTLRQPLITPDEQREHVRLAQELYRMLLAPAEALLQNKTRLLIAPDGPLHSLPFETLIRTPRDPNSNAQQLLADAAYLLKNYTISYVPSVSIMVALQNAPTTISKAPQLPLLVFGDANYSSTSTLAQEKPEFPSLTQMALRDFTLQPLPYSGEEARQISQIWGLPLDSPHMNLGSQASVKRVKELDLARYRMLHFATHAVLQDEILWATQPSLVLSPDQERGPPSLLRFADILELKLDADLVVLSACNTRLGQQHVGEGIVGLTRAFMYAGAQSVVVSLWNVQDQSTSLFMQRFHQHLKDGISKAEALRQAKLEIMHETIELQATGTRESLASPFFWAPFVLVGDWN